MQASLPHVTPSSPVPSKLAARYDMVTNGSCCISTTAAQRGARRGIILTCLSTLGLHRTIMGMEGEMPGQQEEEGHKRQQN